MSGVIIRVADLVFPARFERTRAPKTCAAFASILPFRAQLVQARWSGEAAWVPLGDFDLEVPREHATAHPSRGELLFYPAGLSETELLFPYGGCAFASKAGPLAGNHFLTLTAGYEQLEELGRRVLWEGAQPIEIALDEGDGGPSAHRQR